MPYTKGKSRAFGTSIRSTPSSINALMPTERQRTAAMDVNEPPDGTLVSTDSRSSPPCVETPAPLCSSTLLTEAKLWAL